MKRTFIIGEEWLYYKIYCGARTVDILLTETLGPLLHHFVDTKQIDKWFFIRYTDPENHIRLRLHFEKQEKIGLVIEALKEALVPYIENDAVYKVQTDTYKRELERYGKASIEMAERLFYYDSYFVTQLLDLIEDEHLLVRVQLKNIDDLLDIFGFDDTRKIAFVNRQMNYYKEEHRVNKATNKQLSQKYREQAKAIASYVLQTEQPEEYRALQVLHQQKNKRDIVAVQEILALENRDISTDSLVGSLIHMSVNRTFRSKQRTYEMLLYDFLLRFYRMKKARKHIVVSSQTQ